MKHKGMGSTQRNQLVRQKIPQRFRGTESRPVLLKCGERGEWQEIRLEGRTEARKAMVRT